MLRTRDARIDAVASWIVEHSPRISRAVAVAVAVLVAAPFVYHLARGSQAFLGLLEDDFFYYAIVADKLATAGKLTFDGVTTTNGFHPLWFLVLAAMRFATGGLNAAFFGMLAVVFAASMIATYELSHTFAEVLGASRAAASAVALVFCVATDLVVSSGMETALDVPLLMWLLVALSRPGPVTPARAAKLGLIASLAILARLDVALVVPLALAGWLVVARPPWATVGRAAAAFCAAGVAVPVYAACNLVAFGSALPVSGMAKQLIKQPGFKVRYLMAVAGCTTYGRTAGIALAAGGIALLVLWSRQRTSPARFRLGGGALAMAFAAVFFLLNASSGWVFFGWYAYPLLPALVASATFVGAAALPRIPVAARTRAGALAVVVAALLASRGAVYEFVTRGPLWSGSDSGEYDLSVELAQVMRGRHGVYAMGATAGSVAFQLGEPVVQLEGLVADPAMVEHLRAEDDLVSVLAAYHVDYLVVLVQNSVLEKRDGCYLVSEPDPEFAGTRVARMRGAICAEPIVHLPTRMRAHRWSMSPTLDTYVFDVRGMKSAPAPPLLAVPPRAPTPASTLLRARPYALYVPPAYRPGTPAPLLVAFHGLGSRGPMVASLLGLRDLADTKGILYAFPDGTFDRDGNRCWNATDACDFGESGVDDVAYFRAIVDDVASRYTIDPRRVYAAGVSSGGTMAHRVACDAADRVAAVVSIGGANWREPERCRPSEPVAVLEVHADADEAATVAAWATRPAFAELAWPFLEEHPKPERRSASPSQ
jgi:predicted esterase